MCPRHKRLELHLFTLRHVFTVFLLEISQNWSPGPHHRCPWMRRLRQRGCRSSHACCAGRLTRLGSLGGWTSSSCLPWRSRCCSWGRDPSAAPPGSWTQTDPDSWWTRAPWSSSQRRTPSSSHLPRKVDVTFLNQSIKTRFYSDSVDVLLVVTSWLKKVLLISSWPVLLCRMLKLFQPAQAVTQYHIIKWALTHKKCCKFT